MRAMKIATTYYLQDTNKNSAQPVRVLINEKAAPYAGADLSPLEKRRRMAFCGRKPLPGQLES